MNQEISSLTSSKKLTSTPRASMEKVAPEKGVESTQEAKELKEIEVKMEQIDHAFTLVKEIRTSLERALEDL